jgi:ribosome biogenesis protein BMS1
MSESQQTNKPHRSAKDDSGKKKKKLHANGQNAKAFAVSAPGRLQRQAMRSHDVR